MSTKKTSKPAVRQIMPVFPVAMPTDETGNNVIHYLGIGLRDYAAIKFAASWAIALGTSEMVESTDQRTAEANRLGLLQADAFIEARK